MKHVALFLGALVAACAEPAPAPVERDAPRPSGAAAAFSTAVPEQGVATLAGAWRVAGVDGADFNEEYGLALYGDRAALWWEPRCAQVGLRYAIEGTRFTAEPLRPETPSSGAPDTTNAPQPLTCPVGLPPRLEEVMQVIRGADRIERTPSNGVRISGRGRSVTLFSQ